MRERLFFALLALLSNGLVLSGDRAWGAAGERTGKVLAVHLDELCSSEEDCSLVREIEKIRNGKPMGFRQKTEDGDEWSVVFHFGHTRTEYFPTDLELRSSRIQVVVRNFKFQERTSADAYDPGTWRIVEDAARWIDEPTNTFEFNIQKGNNVIYITIFHPKFLKPDHAVTRVDGVIDGVPVNREIEINQQGQQKSPVGVPRMSLLTLQNTYGQMDYQVGYGRKIRILRLQKGGSLTYTPHVQVGLVQGATSSAYGNPDDPSFMRVDAPLQLQGYGFSIGHKLEYDAGRVNFFIDQRFTYSHLESTFLDGTMSYNLAYSPVTVGVGLRIWKQRRDVLPCPRF